MERSATLAAIGPPARGRWRLYAQLTKPRVVALMMFTVLVGMLLATPTAPPWSVLLFGTLGVGLVAGGAAALNHLVDRRIDALMARTRARPLPRGVLGGLQVLLFAAALAMAGVAVLWWFTNPLCALLTLASLVGYAGIYSVLLKHSTPQNIVIGGAAGAAPPLLGWVAVTGQVDPGAWLLFLIILVWTPPHFWALAIHRREDYAKADVPMLPVTHGVAFTQRRILQYTVVLVAITVLPWLIGMSGWIYLAGALLLGAGYLQQAHALLRDSGQAMPAFRFSIAYLFGLFAALLADHYLLA
ncbi:heme o synthase [Aquabacterium sp.]|uniref:heme o synthase n=1 Tax=Aquabacterium sp. TaxID=1872578 RepID=UPI002C119C19|nr:heme o synthase [Aquabacterium sp.]HSW02948.1 heme o synthase [Aquabacterium sp.]